YQRAEGPWMIGGRSASRGRGGRLAGAGSEDGLELHERAMHQLSRRSFTGVGEIVDAAQLFAAIAKAQGRLLPEMQIEGDLRLEVDDRLADMTGRRARETRAPIGPPLRSEHHRAADHGRKAERRVADPSRHFEPGARTH